MNRFDVRPAIRGARAPQLISPHQPSEPLTHFLRRERGAVLDQVLAHGGVLLRGFALQAVGEFGALPALMGESALDYTYRSTPRTKVAAKVFTSTEYPADQEIPLHNENAYQRQWPARIAFWCRRAAESGGETPIAHMQAVTAAIGPEVVDEFARRGVTYVRHYRPGVDLPWQTVFQTDDRQEMERRCEVADIAFLWLAGDVLRTSQTCHGVAIHPQTRERTFFNQAHLFHATSLEDETRRLLLSEFGPEGLPRHALFGDGGEIPPDMLEHIRGAFARCSVAFPWETGDVLLLDNMQAAHGRRRFAGERSVLVALMGSVATGVQLS